MKLRYLNIFCLNLIFLMGCSTQLRTNEETQNLEFTIQQSSTTPINQSSKVITISDLLPGDIILSSTTGITSWSIRLASLSNVSHASIYLGDKVVAESIGSGTRIIPVQQAIDEANNMVVLRLSGLNSEHAKKLREFSESNNNSDYNYKGIIMLTPWMVTKRICEIPLAPETTRNTCLKTLAKVQLGKSQTNGFFCSQFVLDAYNHAGIPLFDGDSSWTTPADILHMRTNDVPTFTATQRLKYIGHLKLWRPIN